MEYYEDSRYRLRPCPSVFSAPLTSFKMERARSCCLCNVSVTVLAPPADGPLSADDPSEA